MNRAEITKYKAFYPESVYLSTVIKNLETAEPLSVGHPLAVRRGALVAAPLAALHCARHCRHSSVGRAADL